MLLLLLTTHRLRGRGGARFVPGPTELKPTETPAKPLTPGEAEIFGRPIRVTIDGFLRGLFTFDIDGRLIDYGSVLFPDDDLAAGSWKDFCGAAQVDPRAAHDQGGALLKAAAVGRRGFLRVRASRRSPAKPQPTKHSPRPRDFNPLGSVGLQQYGNPGPPSALNVVEAAKRRSSLLNFFRTFRLPQWEIDQIRRDTAVYALDPDIAALRSFSMSVKICMQRERNVARRIEQLERQPAYEELRLKFQSATVFGSGGDPRLPFRNATGVPAI